MAAVTATSKLEEEAAQKAAVDLLQEVLDDARRAEQKSAKRRLRRQRQKQSKRKVLHNNEVLEAAPDHSHCEHNSGGVQNEDSDFQEVPQPSDQDQAVPAMNGDITGTPVDADIAGPQSETLEVSACVWSILRSRCGGELLTGLCEAAGVSALVDNDSHQVHLSGTILQIDAAAVWLCQLHQELDMTTILVGPGIAVSEGLVEMVEAAAACLKVEAEPLHSGTLFRFFGLPEDVRSAAHFLTWAISTFCPPEPTYPPPAPPRAAAPQVHPSTRFNAGSTGLPPRRPPMPSDMESRLALLKRLIDEDWAPSL